MYEPEDRPHSFSRFLIPLGALVVAGAIIAGGAFAFGAFDSGGGDPQAAVQPTPTAVPTATPPGANPGELAIGDYVRNTLKASYAGDCSIASVNQQPAASTTPVAGATTTAPTAVPAGNVLCSQSRGDRDDIHAYVLGKPLADPMYWIFVQQNGGSYTVVGATEITPEVSAVGGTPWPTEAGRRGGRHGCGAVPQRPRRPGPRSGRRRLHPGRYVDRPRDRPCGSGRLQVVAGGRPRRLGRRGVPALRRRPVASTREHKKNAAPRRRVLRVEPDQRETRVRY